MGKRKKYYAVRHGRNPGIYQSWDECRNQVNKFPEAVFKGFLSLEDAQAFMGLSSLSMQSNKRQRFDPEKEMKLVSNYEPLKQNNWDLKFFRKGSSTNPKQIDSGEDEKVKQDDRLKKMFLPSSKSTPYSSFAYRMMEKMGHEDGKGLGKLSNGITSPIEATEMNISKGNCPGIGYGCVVPNEELNALQKEALELAKNGRNVFITGPAGTGKSVTILHIIEFLKYKYKSSNESWVAVAPTGATAIAISGQTIHSFSGVGVPVLARDFEKAWKMRKYWRRLEVMVLDEVSMISGEFFDRLSDIVSIIRNDRRPFGGIQLIMCGDFCQLPPITKRSQDISEMKQAGTLHSDIYCNYGFTFQSHAWNKAQLSIIQLTEIIRQRNKVFANILNEIREGTVSTEAQAFLEKFNRPLPRKDGNVATILYAKNKNVDSENMKELEKLNSETHSYEAIDQVEVESGAPPWAESRLRENGFFKNCIAETKLSLKVGALVMLTKNDVQGIKKNRLVNGSCGKVVGFVTREGVDATSDNYFTIPVGVPEEGTLYPRVRFMNGVEKLITPVSFTSRLVGLGICERIALPLKLAWAITMHKSQGMTLDHVTVDLAGVFSSAQVYVALSRASDEEHLELRNFSVNKVRADERALAFYKDANGEFSCWNQEDI